MKTLPILILVSCVGTLSAQVISPQNDTIRWEYSSVKNLRNNETISLNGYVISHGNHGFDWVQDGGSDVYTIHVTAATGTWTNAASVGELQYQVTCNGLNGTVTLSRETGGVAIHLDFTNGDALTPHLILFINTYQKI